MAIPAWKLAIQERKKKQQQEEELKKVKEEQQMLASLPAWKRAIIMRERKLAGAAPPPSETSSMPVSKTAVKNSGSSIKQPILADNAQPQKWQVAVERVKGADSPVLKRAARMADSPVLRKASPKLLRANAFANNSLSSSKGTDSNKTTETTHQRPLPQKSILNRWNVGASPSPTAIKRSASAAGSYAGSNSPANTRSSAKLSATSSNSPANARSSISKLSTTGSSGNKSSTGLTNSTASSSSKSSTSLTSFTGSTKSSAASSKLGTTHTKPNASSSSTKAVPTSLSEEDPALANLPAWKKALILKKRKEQQKTDSVDRQSKAGEDETDSGFIAEVSANASKQPATTSEPAPVVIKQPVPEVVNRQAESNPADQRLVQQEGKTLHPPIYKEVDQWANVTEEDEKFKKLPPWKQALIRRRRADIALRSGQPLPSPTSTTAQTANNSPTKVKKENLKKQVANDTTAKNAKDASLLKKSPANKSRQMSSKAVENKKNKTASEETVKKKMEPKKSSAYKSSIGSRPVRQAPAIPTSTHSKTEKSEPMFSFNFSKASHHSLDTGDSSSDCTDSDLEDAIVTNLDEDSGESDSGIVLQRYAPSEEQKKSTDMKRASSILVMPGSKKKNKLRRVCWSDSQLVSEHTYPKYDYSDYDEEQKEEEGGNSQFSHRLHPSLLPPTEGDPYASGFSPPGYLQGGSLSNFVPSSLSPSIMENSYSDYSFGVEPPKEEEETSPTSGPVEHDYSDYYSDQSNAGALLW